MENRSSSGKWRAPLIEFKRRVPPKIKFCHYLLTLRSFQTYAAVFQCSTKREIWKKNEDSSALYIFPQLYSLSAFFPSSLDSLTHWIIFTKEASFCHVIEKSTNDFFSRNSACFFFFAIEFLSYSSNTFFLTILKTKIKFWNKLGILTFLPFWI